MTAYAVKMRGRLSCLLFLFCAEVELTHGLLFSRLVACDGRVLERS